MKTVAAILTICVILLLGFMGCLKEEPPPPPPKRPLKFKIVKPPKQQEPEKQKAQIPGEQEKGEIPAKEAEEGKVAVVGELPKKEIGEVKPAGVEEKPLQMPEKGAVAKEAKEVKTALVKEIPKKQAEAAKPVAVKEKLVQRQERVTEEDETERYYIVKKGESLSDVTSRGDVYGNMLKWPVLYRLNIDSLANLKTEGDVVERALPEGLKLRIVGPDEVEENLKKRPNKKWVVNVLSSTTNDDIVTITITLIKNGYSAYLTQARIKGKVWTRLRVGFFNNRKEADVERKKITRMFNISDAWSVKLGQMEFEEFAGY